MIRPGFSLFIILFIPLDLLAQTFAPNPDWRFENFNSQNHFISREIPNLTVDKYGYVWACSRGVQRFDGYKTIDFNSFDQAKGALRDNTTNVITDNDGRVWVSSAGLCYYDDASGKFIYVQPGPGHTITNVFSLCIQKNYLWFICEYGLAKLDLRSLKISFTSLTAVNDPLCTYLIDNSTLLISSREKVYIYNIKKNTYSTHTLIYQHSLLKIFVITKSSGVIFLGTDHGLFTLENLKDISLVHKQTSDMVINDLLFMPQDKEKKYLFIATTEKGLMVYNTVLKKSVFTYVHDDDNPFSLPNNAVSSLFTDKKGRLWIGTDLGISMLDIANQQLKMRFFHKTNTNELSINKIVSDKYDSAKVWMSGYSQGIICMNWKTKKIEKIFDADAELHKINDLVQLSENKWLLVTQNSIIEWSPESGILLKTKLPVPDSLSLVYSIRRIIMADANTCFITTNKGLFKYDLATHQVNIAPQINRSKNLADPLKYNLINGFYDHGILWIASRNGLFSYDIATHATTVYRGEGRKLDYFFFDITRASNNQIVCAAGDGITIFNKQTKSFKVVNSIANLYNPYCLSVTSINNMVWIGTETGILTYDLDTHKSARAEHTNPLMQIFPTSPFAIIGNDIVLGFRNGYAYFTPDLKNISIPSNPVIERVYVNNQPVLQDYPKSSDKKLVFSYLDNSINIAFTAFLYADPDHINFRYRLKGANNQWQYTRDERSANYAQLPPGNYTFYVQCGNKNGVWNNNLASFGFIITPPYWATWWFRLLVILVIALALYRLYKYRINHLLAIEKIRERIASDFHDDIGAALSSISIFSEVADTQLEEQLPHAQTREIISHISFQSRAMLDAMDDIIWAVNPKNDHFTDLAVRMREFAIPLLEVKNIKFDIKIQEEILNTRLNMEARKNIFLIFKESINNILKHSYCTAMKVSVNKISNQVELIISDNGRGFDIHVPHTRNGLKNMEKRAAEINGTLQVTTAQGKGTVTRLLVNIV